MQFVFSNRKFDKNDNNYDNDNNNDNDNDTNMAELAKPKYLTAPMTLLSIPGIVTKNVLYVPLRNHGGEIVGVLEISNTIGR